MSLPEAPKAGRCACGAVHFTVSHIVDIGDCHCRMCQRTVGAAYVTWATVADSALQITGAVRWWRSSPGARRGFCETCGASLFFRRDEGTHTDVTVATFDNPHELAPAYAIWLASRHPWVPLDPTIPGHDDEGPDRS